MPSYLRTLCLAILMGVGASAFAAPAPAPCGQVREQLSHAQAQQRRAEHKRQGQVAAKRRVKELKAKLAACKPVEADVLCTRVSCP